MRSMAETERSDGPRYGVSLLRVHPALWRDVAIEAERAGYESIWMSDHLMLPEEVDREKYPDGELPISSHSPIFDVMVHLAALAAVTTTLRLGTYVYQPALRHPFVAARAVATLDVVSGGRVELGVGAGWSEAEWDLVGVDFARRGELLDETLDVLDGLWTQKSFAYQGAHHEFPSVGFEPKPVQQPRPPLHIGGESAPALRRAVARGDGWIGMHHTPASVAAPLARLRAAERDSGRSRPLQTTVAAHQGAVDAEGWSASGIDRVIVAPWSRSGEAIDGLRRFAREHIRPRSE